MQDFIEIWRRVQRRPDCTESSLNEQSFAIDILLRISCRLLIIGVGYFTGITSVWFASQTTTTQPAVQSHEDPKLTINNKKWTLASRPVGHFKPENFAWQEEELPELQDGQLLIANKMLSLDPTQRGWAAHDTYLPAMGIGDAIRGMGVGTVLESKHQKFAAGDLVQGMLNWQTHTISDGQVSPVPDISPLPLEAHFGLFGHIGATAYFGLLEVAEPKAGETLVVTGAAGAVGSLVCQIGKIKGLRVVGIAGTDEKCRWLTEDLGIDAAINYKTERVGKMLKKHAPDGIDVVFENVGGVIMDTIMSQLNNFARIALCGMIANYNAKSPVAGPYSFGNILVKRARVQGFIVLDYMHRAGEMMAEMGKWHAEGRMQYRVDVQKGLENAPDAINMLFDGRNKGKLLLEI